MAAAPSRRDAAPVLLADVGGTFARFALLRDGRVGQARRLPTRDHAGLAAAAEAYLARTGAARPPRRPGRAVVAVAGPVTGDRVRLTNHPWAFSVSGLRRRLRLSALDLLNDFEALAWSLPVLEPGDLSKIGRGRATGSAPRAVLGPGTGLGLAALVPAPGGATALATEGGHVTLAAGDAREAEVIARLRTRFGHVSAERALSGPGLVNLYRALADIEGVPARLARPGAIARAARGVPRDRLARAAVRLFSGLLGAYAGDVALAFGARGGVYIAGGVVPRLGGAFDRRAFRRRFADKGRYRDYLAAVPTWLVTAKDPAFRGLAAFAAARPGAG